MATKADLPASPPPSSTASAGPQKIMKITALLGVALASMGLGFIAPLNLTAEVAPSGFVAICFIAHLSVFFVAPMVHAGVFGLVVAGTPVVACICGYISALTDSGPLSQEVATYMFWWCSIAYPPLMISMVWFLAPEAKLGSLIGVVYLINSQLGPILEGSFFPSKQRLGVMISLVQAGTWISLIGCLCIAAALPLFLGVSAGSIPRLAVFEDSRVNRHMFFLALAQLASNMAFQIPRISMVMEPANTYITEGTLIILTVLVVAYLAEKALIDTSAISRVLLHMSNAGAGVGGLLAAISYMLEHLDTPNLKAAKIVAEVALGLLRFSQVGMFGLIYLQTAVFLKNNDVKTTGILSVVRMLFTVQLMTLILQKVRVALGLGGLLEQNALPVHFIELSMLCSFMYGFMPSAVEAN